MRQLSKAGAGFIASFEAIILEAYPDPGTGGVPWTAGIGHTDAAGEPKVRPGDIWTMQKAFQVFASDMPKYERRVDKAIKAEISQADFDALVSLDFNTGQIVGGSVDDKLNAGQREAAIQTLGQYTRAAGKVMTGLVSRRNAEMQIMRTGQYPSRKILVKDRYKAQGRLIDASAIVWREPKDIAPALALDKPLPPIVMSPTPRPSNWTAVWRFMKGFFV